MINIKTLFYAVSITCILYSFNKTIKIVKSKGKIKRVKAKIIDIELTLPNPMIVRNSKKAMVEYYHNGKRITSKDPIVVAMNRNIGDQINIMYHTNQPEEVLTNVVNTLFVSLGIGVILFIIGFLS